MNPTKMTTQSSIPDEDIIASIRYRTPLPHEIPSCHKIESASYPIDEAASLDSLEYRRENAPNYFQCAISNDDDSIIGFVCATRCDRFEEESMSSHTAMGALLAIHSVVVEESYRKKGVATAMLTSYLETVQRQEVDDGSGGSGIQSVVLLAKTHLLGFYVNCGFQVNRLSPIIHGRERWYELERTFVRSRPLDGDGQESWFCKTEQFIRPFPEVRPHLEAHKRWVVDLRRQGYCVTSGYRVDSEGRPGGGGLMFLAAKNYEDARALVLKDPLVAMDVLSGNLMDGSAKLEIYKCDSA
eukprot:CAMPEP_0198250822 /NCGR_PEP_ID=MMETSP1447-20131203/1859_1 /TAXON_ID=420782 /ORGANISM="Chaetoceros dichaeta, Strain CCMP1751" /LENGTH=297 /DNA_ID=CAMNT_0043935709 /DNA_START=158 /DNA_END=1049 /DNA_ORIENTATION=+